MAATHQLCGVVLLIVTLSLVVQGAVQKSGYFIKTTTAKTIDGSDADWRSILTTQPVVDQFSNTVCTLNST